MQWNTTSLEAPNNKIHYFLFLFFFSSISLADYAWIPKYKSLHTKLGFDYTASKENFGSDGDRNDINYQSRLVQFTEYRFWLEGEYGIAKDVSTYLRPTFLWNAINPVTGTGTGFPAKGGISDVYLGFKWNPIQAPVLFTPEIISKVALYSNSSLAADELALGDGDFSVGALANLGYRVNNYLVLGFSPGLLYRSNNFSTQALINGMVGIVYNPVFLRLFWDWKLSLSKEELAGLVTDNSAPGSGATFARLSRNQDLLSAGVKFGVKFYENYRIDFNFMQAMKGTLAPYYWQLGFNFFAPFDFYREEKKIKVREIPFESTQIPEG